MNKIVIVAVFIFWSAVSFFYASSLVRGNTSGSNSQPAINTNTNSSASAGTLAAQLPSHNNKNDCWLAIDGKVYDVTDYIYSHPGGANEIIKYCGQDATKGFTSKDKFIPQDHSQYAYALLNNYYIGDLNSSATSNGQNSGTSASNSNTNTNSNTSNAVSQNTNSPSPVSYTLTTALVAQHNSASDCWVTANNNVYNVTSYIYSHPGGASAITPYCGSDIEAAFVAQGHSQNAVNIMASYKIGTIGGIVDNSTVSAVNNNTPPVSNNRGGDDNEWEDD